MLTGLFVQQDDVVTIPASKIVTSHVAGSQVTVLFRKRSTPLTFCAAFDKEGRPISSPFVVPDCSIKP